MKFTTTRVYEKEFSTYSLGLETAANSRHYDARSFDKYEI